MMLQQEPTGSPLLAQVLHHFNRRRHKGYTFLGISLTLLSIIWIFGRLASDDGSGRDQSPTAAGYESSGPSIELHDPTAHANHLISSKIWQILLPKKPQVDNFAVNPEALQHTASWLAMNPDYKYTLVGQKGGREFVQRHFAHDPKVVQTYNSLSNVGLKSDLLRYLILDVEGGVYTDTDTIALKPIDNWVPLDIRDRVRLIVGIEFDRRDGGAWADIPHWLQFCQWTIAAAPGHPVFRKMVTRVLHSLDELSEIHELPVSELQPSSFEVMNSTGPAAWTDVVFAQLQEYDSTLSALSDLSFMTEPKLYGDILVLNIDGFGMGQSHSHSTHNGSIPELALMKHLFQGTWRGN